VELVDPFVCVVPLVPVVLPVDEPDEPASANVRLGRRANASRVTVLRNIIRSPCLKLEKKKSLERLSSRLEG